MENKNPEIRSFEMEIPTNLQDAFLRAKTPFVAFGGYKGGGKLWAARSKALFMGLNYPGIVIAFIGREFVTLKRDIADEIVKKSDGFARYDEKRKRIVLKNGSEIYFRLCKSGDLSSIAGAEFDVLFILDAGEYESDDLKEISYRCRGYNDFPKRVYYIFNWFNKYIERVFIKKEYKETENPNNYTLISSKPTESLERAEVPKINTMEIYGA